MGRIVRVGIPDSRILEVKAYNAIRYISRHNKFIDMQRVRVGRSNIFEELKNHNVDLVVAEYSQLSEYENCDNGDNEFTIGLVLPQGDTRDVLITRKSSHNRFDRAVVECHSDAARHFVENTYDGVSCRDTRDNEALQIDRIISRQCDAAVMSADRLRSIKADHNRNLNYTFFKNSFDTIGTKAVWVAVIRRDDVKLSQLLMPMSDEGTLKGLVECRNI